MPCTSNDLIVRLKRRNENNTHEEPIAKRNCLLSCENEEKEAAAPEVVSDDSLLTSCSNGPVIVSNSSLISIPTGDIIAVNSNNSPNLQNILSSSSPHLITKELELDNTGSPVSPISGESSYSSSPGLNVQAVQAAETSLGDTPPSRPHQPAYEPKFPFSENKPPPCDFRTLSHMPAKEDVHNPAIPYVRRSKTRGAYESLDHYLDVQFRLLHQDMVTPLREGILHYKDTGSSRYEKLVEDDLSSDLAVFELDSIEGVQIKWHTGERIRYVKLTKPADPNVVNHLQFGQVVCLSSDGFRNDIHLAVVAERDNKKMTSYGKLGLAFLSNEALQKNSKYFMAEPSSYLEGYQHVLLVIKSISRFSPLPLERYLVHCRKNIRLPLYMRVNETAEDIKEDLKVMTYYSSLRIEEMARRLIETRKKLEMTTSQRTALEGKCSASDRDNDSDLEDLSVPILKARSSPNAFVPETISIHGVMYNIATLEKDFKSNLYDASQRQALVAALTRELAIIQGPPGTGKTFIGVEIVRTMLENRDHFCIQKPILLVCYTNTALDQFLERIIEKVSDDISKGSLRHGGPIGVRLGSKSSSEKLEKANVLRKDVIRLHKDTLSVHDKQDLNLASREKHQESSILNAVIFAVNESRKTMMSYYSIQQVMGPDHHGEFVNWAKLQVDSSGQALNLDEALACWLLDKSFAPKSDSKTIDQNVVTTGWSEISSKSLCHESYDSAKDVDMENEFDGDYEMDSRWDVARLQDVFTMKIFGETTKESSIDFALMKMKAKKKNDFRRIGKQGPLKIDQFIKTALERISSDVLKAMPLSLAECNGVSSLFSISKTQRWELYAFWRKQLSIVMRAEMPGQVQKFQLACKKHEDVQLNFNAKIFSKSLIIGATTTGAAKSRKMLEKIGCKILIVDEAAQVLEAHILSAMLPSLEHAVFIGDHQQLRPNNSVFKLAREYGLNISMFERMIKNGLPFNTLLLQHRMNATITRAVVRPYFYKKLKDAGSVHKYPSVAGMVKPLFFWSHTSPESVAYGSPSFQNQHEVKMVIGLADYIVKQQVYGHSDITIISTYSAQTEALRSAVTMRFGLNPVGKEPAIAVETVDSFQGKENKIVIVSLVRSLGPTIGFLTISNRICVALTRAQHGMYVVGNLDHLSNCSKLWKSIGHSLLEEQATGAGLPVNCKTHGTVSTIIDPDDFRTILSDGSCTKLCATPLPCSHSCQRKCHPVDDHSSTKCRQPCVRVCDNEQFQHPCGRLCYESCGACTEMVKAQLECGHDITIPCGKSVEVLRDSRCEDCDNDEQQSSEMGEESLVK